MPVVEFLGVPGSGKSTLARAVVDSSAGVVGLDEAGRDSIRAHGTDSLFRIVSRLPGPSTGRLWKAVYARSPDRFEALTRFLATHPSSLECLLTAQQRRSGRDIGQEMVLGWVLNLMARYQLATEAEFDGWLVLDEGFCQRGVAVFAQGFAAEDHALLDAYLAAIPTPDVVVEVVTPLRVCEQRLDEGGWSNRVRDLDGEARRRFLASSAAVVERITSRLRRMPVRMIQVDGSSPLEVSLALIAATLSS